MTHHVDKPTGSSNPEIVEANGTARSSLFSAETDRSHSIRHARDKAKRSSIRLVQSLKSRAHAAKQNEVVEERPQDDPRNEIDRNPAFAPARLEDVEAAATNDTEASGLIEKARDKLAKAGKAIKHPIDTVKQQAAVTAAISDRPYSSLKADKELLDAHAQLNELNDISSIDEDDNDLFGRRQDQDERIERLEDLRKARRAAWVTRTNVHRVVVDHARSIPEPTRDQFYSIDVPSGRRSLDFSTYASAKARAYLKDIAINHLGNVDHSTHEEFNRDLCLRYAERLVMASSPWQAYCLSLRKLYRWDDPKHTGKWALIWFVIWWLDYPMTFIYGYVLYIVIRNRYQNVELQTMRESHDRSTNDKASQQPALRFDELLRRHGTSDWIDPLLETVGPKLQVQLFDLADFLEILQSFYQWRNPRETKGTLFFFACAIFFGIMAPRDQSVKWTWMLGLLYFFLSRPIASKHPQYRHCVNALRWIFWNIPTDAEWSLTYLRTKAQETRAALIDAKVQAASDGSSSLAVYPAHGQGRLDTFDKPDQYGKVMSDSPVDACSISSTDTFHTATATVSFLDGMEIAVFKCQAEFGPSHHNSKLTITSDGLRHVATRTATRNLLHLKKAQTQIEHEWSFDWPLLLEMRKTQKSKLNTISKKIAPQIAPVRGLEFVFVVAASVKTQHEDVAMQTRDEGTSELVRVSSQRKRIVRFEYVEDRDKAFNCIVGFSGLAFRVLEPLQEQWQSEGNKHVNDLGEREEDTVTNLHVSQGGWFQ